MGFQREVENLKNNVDELINMFQERIQELEKQLDQKNNEIKFKADLIMDKFFGIAFSQ